MIREQIRKDVLEAIRQLGYWDVGKIAPKNLTTQKPNNLIGVTRTQDPKFGDYATNAALKIRSSVFSSRLSDTGQPVSRLTHSINSGQAGKRKTGKLQSENRKPKTGNKQSATEIANILADSLKGLPYIKKLEVAGPGFLNFFIKEEIWQEEVEKILGSTKGQKGKRTKGQKVIVEFTDPNPFKEFHIGHLYSNIVGESICRLLEETGAQVKRANYQGDVGMHVAKTIWAIPKLLNQENETFAEQEKKDLSARVFFLGQAYSLGAKEFEASDVIKKEIAELNKKIFAKDPSIFEFYEKGRKWSLDYFEEIYKRLGTKFDYYYFESEVGEVGVRIVREFLKKGIFVESEGAIIFPGEKEGLHNRVFINSLGLPTYEAKELGLAPTKYEQFKYDQSIIVTGNEINEYFKVLLAALLKIRPDLAQKTKHIGHGMVRMPGGKISSRLGNVILGEWLLDEAKRRVREAFSGVSDALSEQIGTGAVKYALLKGSIGQDVAFSFEESISLNGNSGPYLQYTYARCRSVLAKVESGKLKVESLDLSKLSGEEDLLLRALGHFEEAVVDAANGFAPNLAANFLYEVAQKYNTLYNNLPILKAGEGERSRRLFLTEATAGILKKGLYLLGIEAPQKM
ncbi:arginine--tRNA ligase [Candidatus Curtissbacteria bacterium]|nr:arginine--tRNA ligase [Candidatus Curtissbacteria bacterium]